MRSVFYIFISVILLSGCVTKTNYVEKQSKALSQAVYAASDSFNQGRFDQTDYYLAETTKLVTPPEEKDRIKIKPIITK